jgi:hypothetical protein
MNFASPVSYPDVDAAAFDWSAVKPQFSDWQTEQIHNLSKMALDVLYCSDKSDAYKCGYSKTILHTIQNITLIKDKAEG